MEPLTYAKAGGPPANWQGLKVFDLDTSQEVLDVEEVNSAEGWLVRFKRGDDGGFVLNEYRDGVERERIEGRFEIRGL